MNVSNVNQFVIKVRSTPLWQIACHMGSSGADPEFFAWRVEGCRYERMLMVQDNVMFKHYHCYYQSVQLASTEQMVVCKII